jgi:hypothetical protein
MPHRFAERFVVRARNAGLARIVLREFSGNAVLSMMRPTSLYVLY